jgi:hypothetical protein
LAKEELNIRIFNKLFFSAMRLKRLDARPLSKTLSVNSLIRKSFKLDL